MDPLPGHVTTPPGRGIPEVGQIPELPALEEALPHVLDAPLHVGLVPGVTHPCGVGDEATMLGVLQEAPGEPGVQSVGAGHRGGEVVDDQVSGDTAEELPGGFQAGYHILQPLAMGGPDEAVPGVTQHHHQRPHRAAAATVRVADVAQPPEVQLGHLTGRTLPHPHSPGVAATPVATLDEPAQRGVGHPAAPLSQQLLDTGHLQTVNAEPAVHLVAPGG